LAQAQAQNLGDRKWLLEVVLWGGVARRPGSEQYFLMACIMFDLFFAFALLVAGTQSSTDVRLVDGAGGLANVGLLQIKTDAGFGTVCGANAAAADVICRAMGFARGSVSSSPCGFYGGADVCGAQGSPVAMADLTCSGSEWSVEECMWSQPNDSCAGHAFDTVVYCTALDEAGASQGAVRLISDDGSPSIDGQGRPEINMGGIWLAICNSGLSPGTAAVICKSMGFSGATGSAKCSGAACGSAAPGVSELACSGAESEPLACPHEAGDDVFCAPSESIVVACAGDGDSQGRPAKEVAPQFST